MSEEKKSWRDVYKVHPAADLFPMLPEEELRKLGEDIKKNGLKETIVLWSHDGSKSDLLDGRNRLDAMELVGIDVVSKKGSGDHLGISHITLFGRNADACSYVISKNIRRRHLTKEQQADLIVKVMKASENDLAEAAKSKNDLAKSARSFSPEPGKRGGSTKDQFKAKVVEEAAKHGISKRTAENAIAKDKGPVQKPRESANTTKTPSPEPSRADLPRDSTKQSPEITPGSGTKSLEERLRESEQARRQIEIHAQREIGRLEGELRDAQKRIAGQGTTIEKLKAAIEKLKDKNATYRENEETYKKTLRDLEQYVKSSPFIGNRFGGTVNRDRIDIIKLRRDLSKKYHPDLNPNKMVPTSEVMALINRVFDGVNPVRGRQ